MALNFKDTFGAVGDGSTPCGNALQAALAQLGEGLYVPAGRYIIEKSVAQTLVSANIPAGFAIYGDGAGLTQFIFPNGDNVELIQTNSRQGLTVRDMSFLTAKPGAGNKSGLKLSSTAPYAQPAQSAITRVSFSGLSGADTGLDYWFCGIEANGWPAINFDTVHHVGSTQHGIGTRLTGISSAKYGILYNFKGCLHEFLDRGILYDNWIQGVTVTGGSNFNQCNLGVHAPASAQGELAQLAVSNSQFDCLRYGIFTEQAIDGLHVHDCEFFIRNNKVGIYAPKSLYVQAHHNLFLGSGRYGEGQGIHIGPPALSGYINGNCFRSLTWGCVLDPGTYGVYAGTNAYSDSGKFLNYGSGNTIPASEI